MKMNEKILQCRKRMGMSQEELAQQLHTTRQAVSQWELGNAQPGLDNVIALAKLFGVTTDWLLLDTEEQQTEQTQPDPVPQPEEPQYEARPEYASPAAATSSDSWIDHLPNVISRLIRRYGWMYGVYLAIGGLLFAIMGGAAVSISNSMLNYDSGMMSGMGTGFIGGFSALYDESGAVITDPDIYRALGMAEPSFAGGSSFPNPVAALGELIIVIGVIMIIGGAVLAYVLKKKANQGT